MNMKKNRLVSALTALLLCPALLLPFSSCEKELTGVTRGRLPDEDMVSDAENNQYAFLRSVRSAGQEAHISLVEGTGTTMDILSCRLTGQAPSGLSLSAVPDPSLVEQYNVANGTDFLSFPEANVTLGSEGNFTVAEGGRSSGRIPVVFRATDLEPGAYMLPVVLSSDDVALSDDGRILYYVVNVRDIDLEYELHGQKTEFEMYDECLNVFYVNTSRYSPLIANSWLLDKINVMNFQTEWVKTYGDIVNLRTVQLARDGSTGRALLSLNGDIRHILNNVDTYVRPLQDVGRKVCLCIEPDGKGLGLCNMTDVQIEDFVAQIKACVELYGLDGVNFYDRNIGYDEAGAPAWDNASYPKLIKAVYEALHPSGKLVTLADYEAPTEYFWDTEVTGGIEVGNYLDYAWSGYMSESEDLQILDPYGLADQEQMEMMGAVFPLSSHPRRPIAGLPVERYGMFAAAFYANNSPFMQTMQGYMNLYAWTGLRTYPNNIIVWGDLISNSQGVYEGAWNNISSMIWMCYDPDAMEGSVMYGITMLNETRDGIPQYDEYVKDW